MNKNKMVNARVDANVKEIAESIFAAIGITMSDAINVFLRQAVYYGGFPFAVKVPNPETIAAIEEGRRLVKDPNAERYSDIDSLWRALQA